MPRKNGKLKHSCMELFTVSGMLQHIPSSVVYKCVNAPCNFIKHSSHLNWKIKHTFALWSAHAKFFKWQIKYCLPLILTCKYNKIPCRIIIPKLVANFQFLMKNSFLWNRLDWEAIKYCIPLYNNYGLCACGPNNSSACDYSYNLEYS